ncbi:GNAT family N-acetyltransferase [Proteiniclasticum sp.]|uniref:GNAT family N-acetyltransferase n=1 Tax=Proteiniclasticum sp. TaxID=2053595 RepID=UPI0028A15167|nr:GNAT family N-acetyltransferase [Proteiniclasticum sp.]
MNTKLLDIRQIDMRKVEKLYNDAGWSAYTEDLDVLESALTHSLDVITAWEDEELIGLIRTVGDGQTILYIQDILIMKSHRDKGIGSMLLQEVLEKYKHVRQKVLLTEEARNVRHFYEKNGFESCDRGTLVAFARFK